MRYQKPKENLGSLPSLPWAVEAIFGDAWLAVCAAPRGAEMFSFYVCSSSMNISHFEHTPSDTQMLSEAMGALKRLVPFEWEVEFVELVGQGTAGTILKAKFFGSEEWWTLLVKRRLSMAVELLALLNNIDKQRPVLLVTDYVSPEAATRMREQGTKFADTVGNAFISRPRCKSPLSPLFQRGGDVDEHRYNNGRVLNRGTGKGLQTGGPGGTLSALKAALVICCTTKSAAMADNLMKTDGTRQY